MFVVSKFWCCQITRTRMPAPETELQTTAISTDVAATTTAPSFLYHVEGPVNALYSDIMNWLMCKVSWGRLMFRYFVTNTMQQKAHNAENTHWSSFTITLLNAQFYFWNCYYFHIYTECIRRKLWHILWFLSLAIGFIRQGNKLFTKFLLKYC